MPGRSPPRAGAGRVELCRELEQGGLTPTRDHVAETMEGAGGPVFVMVRPRGDTFRLAPGDLGAMVSEVGDMSSLGVSGVVVGALGPGGRIDVGALTELEAAAGSIPVTFHHSGIPDRWSHWPDHPSIGVPNYYAWAYLSGTLAAEQTGDRARAERYLERSQAWMALGS